MSSRQRSFAFALVFTGATLGGMLRLGIDHAFGFELPWEIAVINVVGSLALGVVAGWTANKPQPLLYAAVGPGLLGGFTTFSGLAAFAWDGNAPQAHIAILLITTACAVAGAAAGWVVGSRLGRTGDPVPQAQVVP